MILVNTSWTYSRSFPYLQWCSKRSEWQKYFCRYKFRLKKKILFLHFFDVIFFNLWKWTLPAPIGKMTTQHIFPEGCLHAFMFTESLKVIRSILIDREYFLVIQCKFAVQCILHVSSSKWRLNMHFQHTLNAIKDFHLKCSSWNNACIVYCHFRRKN